MRAAYCASDNIFGTLYALVVSASECCGRLQAIRQSGLLFRFRTPGSAPWRLVLCQR
jgi:hypothetical protein